MDIREVTSQQAWETFVLRQLPLTFLHSWEWGQVQRATGEGVRYLHIYNEDKCVGAALLVTVRARRGSFYLVPHGPIAGDRHYADVVRTVAAYARDHARDDGSVALKIAPLVTTPSPQAGVFKHGGFRPAPLHIHAELTWELDISPAEDDLLSGMRKTTRHAVKKAAQAGVETEIVTDAGGLKRFMPLYATTGKRHGFVPFTESFLNVQTQAFAKHNRMFFAFATYSGQDVAAAMLIHYADTVFYHHGASVGLPSSIPAAQVLQWESMREAKRRGANTYNFWGIAPEEDASHPFAGITIFKKGFGGRAVDYMHAQDLPLSIGYWKLWAVDTWRKYRRGFS